MLLRGLGRTLCFYMLAYALFYDMWMYPLSRLQDHGGKRGDYQNCSVSYCVLKLCTVISTLLWIGFCHTRPMSLCIDLLVFICVYFVCFCFLLHICCIIVSTVGWT